MSLYEQNLYKSMSLDIFNGQSNPNTEINFLYLGQDMYFRVDPSKDELIGPKEYVYDTKSMLPASRVNDYNFFYTFSYPVIVEINDKYNGKDNYQFIFALQSNMVNNLNLQDYWNNDQNQIYWDPSYLKLNVNDPLVGASIPGISGGKPVNYTYKSRPTKNIFCEDTQKQSGEIKVKTYDAMTNKPLSDVVLTYGCGNYVSCNIGRTALNVTLGYSTYSAQLPICMNGYLTLEKPNYQKQSIPLTTVAGIDDDLGSIYLEPIVTKNVSIMKNIMERHYKQEKKVTVLGVIKSVYTEGILDPTSTNAVFIGNYLAANNTKLGLNDTVILTLTKINTSALEASYSQTIVFGQDATSNTTTLNLVPGSYTIKAQLIDYLGVLIHKQCKTICVDKNALQTVFGGCKTTKIPQDDLSIVPAVWGGVEFTAQDPFIVTSNDLKGNKTLEFYVVRLPDPRCIDDLSEPSTVPLITQNNRIKLIPKWK